MSIRSDFTVLPIRRHLGDKKKDLPGVHYPWSGDSTGEIPFDIDGKPVDEGCLTIQSYDVDFSSHRVLINGRDLPGSAELPLASSDKKWSTWTTDIPAGFLRKGRNTIEVRRGSPTGDNFLVRDVFIHWHEIDPIRMVWSAVPAVPK